MVVQEFEGHSRAVLRFRGKDITVTDVKATEVMKSVYISCGLPKAAREGDPVLPRLVIDAPRKLTILREELYHRGKSKGSAHSGTTIPDSA